MESQIAALGLEFEVVDAVLGKGLEASALARLVDTDANQRRFFRPLTPGEIGCYASHVVCWRMLVERGWPHALILEDDLRLTDRLPRLLAQIPRLSPGWDIVKLIGRGRDRRRSSRPLAPDLELISYRRIPSLTGAYLVSAGGAAKLLRRVPPFARPIDVDLRHAWEADINVLGISPYPVERSQASADDSTIGIRRTPKGLPTRWRKIRYQIAYSWHNWRHPQRLLDAPPKA